jgi:hypothetical protein
MVVDVAFCGDNDNGLNAAPLLFRRLITVD